MILSFRKSFAFCVMPLLLFLLVFPLICLVISMLSEVFSGWLRTAGLPPYQGVENVVPVPKKLDREERANPDEVNMMASDHS